MPIHVSTSDIKTGAWYDRCFREWSDGNVDLVTVEPEPSGDPELRKAIDTMLDSTNAYEPGDTAIIHTRLQSVDMAGEAAFALRDRGVTSNVVLGMVSLDEELAQLLKAVYKTDDLAGADASGLAGVMDGYRAFLEPIGRNGRGHWLLAYPASKDPRPENTQAVNVFKKVAEKGLADVGAYREDGRIKSHDIWFYPTAIDVERLNDGLPANRQWTLEEWRNVIFKAMAVSADELEHCAMNIDAVQLTIEASLRGGTLRYRRDDGTDFTYRVEGRPVLLDCGKVGNNSLGGTTPQIARITNHPPTEAFCSPLEQSMNGTIVYMQPLLTPLGVIEAPYIIYVSGGRVLKVEATDKTSEKILREYTGLEPFDSKPFKNGDERDAFYMRGTVAEMAIAGFNPVTEPYIRAGRLRPVVGNLLIDEKAGDHQAFGSNDIFGGTTPSSYKGEHVEHTDFIGSIQRRLELLR